MEKIGNTKPKEQEYVFGRDGKFVNKRTIEQMVLISAMGRQCEKFATNCPEKDWTKKFKTVSSYMKSILRQKYDSIQRSDKAALLRRAEHTVVKFMTSDEYKMPKNQQGAAEEKIVLTVDDYYDLMELACQHCLLCSQGENVKKCKWRKMWHKHGTPVARENPKAGECEYRWDNEIRFVDPHTLKELKPI